MVHVGFSFFIVFVCNAKAISFGISNTAGLLHNNQMVSHFCSKQQSSIPFSAKNGVFFSWNCLAQVLGLVIMAI